MHSTLAPTGSQVVAFAKQYREGELRAAGQPRPASSSKKLRGTTWRRKA